MNFGRLRANAGQLEHAKNTLFHFLGLCRRFVKAALEVGTTTFPGHVDGFPHRIGHDDKLGRPSVLVASKCHDVGLDRHSSVDPNRLKKQEAGNGPDCRPKYGYLDLSCSAVVII